MSKVILERVPYTEVECPVEGMESSNASHTEISQNTTVTGAEVKRESDRCVLHLGLNTCGGTKTDYTGTSSEVTTFDLTAYKIIQTDTLPFGALSLISQDEVVHCT